ncbi:MAG: carbohydrate ABC transporter permease [Anaerolineae bacterium]|nr:carbohydrate ABC transporter permease [Anaerolineae bacterium]
MIEDKSWSWQVLRGVNYIVLSLIGLICILPLAHFLAVSFSDRAASVGGLVTLWPIRFTTASYELVLKAPLFYQSLLVSTQRIIFGVSLQMAITILTAYPLSKTARRFKGRNLFMWLLLVGLFTDWGIIPWWLVIRNLGLMNKIWALVIPPAMSPYNVILMMNFFREIPEELDDAARIDGASHWRRLFNIYMPLSLPAIATLTLFSVVFHWNSWFDGMVLIYDVTKLPLQTFLRSVVIGLDTSNLSLQAGSSQFLLYSDRSIRAASIFLSIVPVLILYPILQGYFVTGIKLGSVKG